MTPVVILKAKVARAIFQDVFKDVDGYYKWAPTGQTGAWDEPGLLMICVLLKEANRLWELEVNTFFEG